MNTIRGDIINHAIPKNFLEIPKFGFINIHASLLPRWRGAAPIQRAIMNQDKKIGVSIMKIEEKLDSGPVLSSKEIEFNQNSTSGEIEKKLSVIGADLLFDTLEAIKPERFYLYLTTNGYYVDEKMAKKLVPIRYTSRDFASIKEDLVGHAKRYYPDTFRDFNEAGFGSLMLDTVAYVGDILSFYVDYQANESFLDTAVEYNNVIRIARQMGYRLKGAPSSYGTATFYIIVPADPVGGPQLIYAPTLLQGSELATTGGNVFTLAENVDFANANNEVVGTVHSSKVIHVLFGSRAETETSD